MATHEKATHEKITVPSVSVEHHPENDKSDKKESKAPMEASSIRVAIEKIDQLVIRLLGNA